MNPFVVGVPVVLAAAVWAGVVSDFLGGRGARVKNDGLAEVVKEQPIQIRGIKRVDYRTDDFSDDSDEVLLARMLFGEARNCSDNEKTAVAYTVLNRVDDGKRWNGTTIKGVILKPWQYSCFNDNDPNKKKLKDPEKYDKVSWGKCLGVARGVVSGESKDFTEGATHYFNPNVVNPSWASKMTRIGRIGNSKHAFYRED